MGFAEPSFIHFMDEDKNARLAEDRMDKRRSYLIGETSIWSLRACGLMSEEVRGRLWLARGDIGLGTKNIEE